MIDLRVVESGLVPVSKTPKVTGRGQRFIVNCFIGEGPAA